MNVCGKSNDPECAVRGASFCQWNMAGGNFVAVLGMPASSPAPMWSALGICGCPSIETLASLVLFSMPADPSLGPNGAQLTYTNGDQCWMPGGRTLTRTVIVNFVCSQVSQ